MVRICTLEEEIFSQKKDALQLKEVEELSPYLDNTEWNHNAPKSRGNYFRFSKIIFYKNKCVCFLDVYLL